jgi:hypothetical protein
MDHCRCDGQCHVFVDPPWAANAPKTHVALVEDANDRPRVVLTARADPGEADPAYQYEMIAAG